MELKTKIQAEDGKQEIFITREFDLPVELLFKAYTEAELVEQWMGTKVLKLENKPHGGYQFETSNPQGEVVFRANGAIHEVIPDRKITRTFQMENTPFPDYHIFITEINLHNLPNLREKYINKI
nr:SRPBCC domain-containing protein [Chryseobacterium luteum]